MWRSRPHGLAAALTLYCVFRARDLAMAWAHAPLDRFAWVAFLCWLAPVGAGRGTPAAWLSTTALAASLAANVSDLHVLTHVALACALGAWAPSSRVHLLWLLSALSWMPAFGWLCGNLGVSTTLTLRLAVAAAGTFPLVVQRRSQPTAR